MKKKKISTKLRIAFLVLLFLGALVFFAFRENYTESKPVRILADSKLPVITMSAYGRALGELCGYVEEMDLNYMRDIIFPLGDDKRLYFSIDPAGSEVSGIKYEVRPLDGERQIEGGEISEFINAGDRLNGYIKFDNLINRGEEYFLIFRLGSDGEPVNYYTRITYHPQAHVDECLRFAEMFHDRTMSKDYAETLVTYMETDRSQPNDTLQNTNIKSSLNQLSWADLDFVQEGEIDREITEISQSSCEINLYYDIVRKGEKARETYRVKEFYRLRRGDDRVYLLNFERTVEEKFLMAAFQGEDDFIDLGIVDPNVNYKYNDIGTICAFVSDGELYMYSQDDNTITKVFSFRGASERSSYRDYGIKILTIDGTGMMDFLVYGYMASGEREGRVGMSLYHYDEAGDEIEERIFIASDRGSRILSADLGDLLYENADGEFFFIMDGVLKKIDIDAADERTVLKSLRSDSYCVSENGRFIAYTEAGKMGTVHLLDLDTGETTDIKAPFATGIYPLTFLQEDFVYGLVRQRDLDGYDLPGRPMYAVRITDSEAPLGRPLKNYERGDCFVTQISVDGYTVYLDRAMRDEEGGWQQIKQDTIMNSQWERMRSVKVLTSDDAVKQKIVSLKLRDRSIGFGEEELGNVKRGVSSLVTSVPETIRLNEEGYLDYYYVYSGSEVVWAGSDPSSAIIEAYNNMGQVIDNRLRNVWKRGRASYKNTISVSVGSFDEESAPEAKCLSAILGLEGENIEVGSLLSRGRSPEDVLSSTLKDMVVMRLTGVAPEHVMYYISRGTPVYTKLGAGTPVLLVGYDNFNFTYFDPTDESVHKVGQQDAAELTAQAGGEFIVYIR